MEGPDAVVAREAAEAVLRRIEAALAGGSASRGGAEAVSGASRGAAEAVSGATLATDADGTLWDGDVGIDLFESLLAARGARQEADEALRREAEACGVAVPGEGAHAAASALYEAWSAGRYEEDRAFAMMAWAFAGWEQGELGAFVERVLEEKGIDARLRGSMRAILDWARGHDVEIFVVSASPRAIVERGVARLGVPAERVLAMTPAIEDGRLLPALAAPATYGDGKVRALERACPALAAGEGLLAAFGDSAYDAPMLRAARVPVAVTPSPKLLALADTIPGLILLDL
jgi:HAD superfamily phosphoserine phosphatase-like hydrolase